MAEEDKRFWPDPNPNAPAGWFLKFQRAGAVKAGLLFLLVLLAYGPAFGAGFLADDRIWILENETLGSLGGLFTIWFSPLHFESYQPLTLMSFWLEYPLWKLDPAGYHATNILLHAANALLVWKLLAALGLPGAWISALLFAVHPVQLESVAWITERKNTLSLFCCLLSALGCARFLKDKSLEWKSYGISLACFGLAALSKGTTAILPLGFLILFWLKRERLSARDLGFLAPFFAVGIGMGLLTFYLESFLAYRNQMLFGWSVWERALIAGRAFWFYLVKLARPLDTAYLYPKWSVDPSSFTQALFPLSALALVGILAAARNRMGKGPLAGTLFFMAMMFPTSGFLNVNYMQHAFVADHWLYLPALGVLALFGAGLSRIASRAVRIALVSGIAMFLAAVTWLKAPVFKAGETFWRYTLAKNPTAWYAHFSLGVELQKGGRPDEAKRRYAEVIRLNPQFAETYNNWGVILYEEGKLDRAIKNFARAIRLKPFYYEDAYHNLRGALARKSGPPDAGGASGRGSVV